MRFLVKVCLDTLAANRAAKEGHLGEKLQAILDDLKPESAYFLAENGKRTAHIIIDMKDAAQLPAIAEPFFLAFNATISAVPVMSPADLGRAEPAIRNAAKKYG